MGEPLPQSIPMGGLLGLPTQRPTTLEAWPSLERMKEVGKVLRRIEESKGHRGGQKE